MHKWMTRIGRAALMGFAWAIVWVPIGMLTGRLIVGEVEPEHVGGRCTRASSAVRSFLPCPGLPRAVSGPTICRSACRRLGSGEWRTGRRASVLARRPAQSRRTPAVGTLPVVLIQFSGCTISAFSAAVSLPIARLFSRNLKGTSRLAASRRAGLGLEAWGSTLGRSHDGRRLHGRRPFLYSWHPHHHRRPVGAGLERSAEIARTRHAGSGRRSADAGMTSFSNDWRRRQNEDTSTPID